MNKAVPIAIEILQIALAIFLASVGLKAFLLPNGFLDGGVTGIAILISTLFSVNISVVLLLVTIPFLILGWFTVSKRILVKSIFSIVILAVCIHFENFSSFTDDKLLIAIFGGLFLGTGIGLAIKNGTVLDGTEIMGIYIHEKFGFSIGSIILAFNTVLFGITAFFLSTEITLYSILTFFVTSKAIDFIFRGFEEYTGLWVISDQSELIQTKLMEEMKTGLTIYKGSKGIGKSGVKADLDIIQVLLNRIDIRKFYSLIDTIDKDAFIVEFDVNGIKGGILRRYMPLLGKR